MKPAPFRYLRPTSLDDALAALHQAVSEASPDGDEFASDRVKVLAGGQSLVPLLSMRLTQPELLIDLNAVAGLNRIERDGEDLRVGAMTRHERLVDDPMITAEVPLVAQAATYIGHRAIRTRGTLGGSLAHADPAAELPLVALALEAEIELASLSGTRRVPASAFFEGPLSTCVGADELIVAVRFPLATARRPFGFAELARRHGDFALALAAVTVAVDADGACRTATIAVGGVAGTPLLLGAAARALIGTRLEDDAVDAAAQAVTAHINPHGDLHASAGYRKAMAQLLVRRAIQTARGAR